ncbi:MAG TPA: hypothetical protein PKN56_11265 [Leptospiraceae bacterium]|nr:hypothetical protein [Leptospiraceae bacterium]HNN04132.1 hypothetical protein [Leptospiraceae bacterium]
MPFNKRNETEFETAETHRKEKLPANTKKTSVESKRSPASVFDFPAEQRPHECNVRSAGSYMKSSHRI